MTTASIPRNSGGMQHLEKEEPSKKEDEKERECLADRTHPSPDVTRIRESSWHEALVRTARGSHKYMVVSERRAPFAEGVEGLTFSAYHG